MLTTVANAFSSLYSQVSGTPLQRIGSMSSVTSTKEATDSPPPLTRSNTANRLMKTLSKLNLCVDKTEKGEGSPSPSSEKGKALSISLAEDSAGKNDPKLQKVMKKKESSSTLATVTEEVSGSSSTITDSVDTDRLSDDADSNISHKMESEGSKETPSQEDKLLPKSGVTGSDLGCDVNVPSHCESESSSELRSAHASTSDKEPGAPLTIPFIRNIMTQQKDSFEMEEVGEWFPGTSNEPGREASERVYMMGGAGTFVAMEVRPCVDSLVLSPTNQELVAELCVVAPLRPDCHVISLQMTFYLQPFFPQA